MLDANKKVGLELNTKNKYMLVSHHKQCRRKSQFTDC